MSQENVEIVRRVVDAWNRRDEEELVALSDPEAEWVNSPTAVEPGTRRGTNELRAVWRMQWEILLDGRIEIDRIYEPGEEIVALGRLSRRTRSFVLVRLQTPPVGKSVASTTQVLVAREITKG